MLLALNFIPVCLQRGGGQGCLLETGFFICIGCWFYLSVCLVFFLLLDSYIIWSILIAQTKLCCCIITSFWCNELRLVLNLGWEYNCKVCTHTGISGGVSLQKSALLYYDTIHFVDIIWKASLWLIYRFWTEVFNNNDGFIIVTVTSSSGESPMLIGHLTRTI